MSHKDKHGRVTDLEGDPQNFSSENFGGGKSGRTRPELVKRRMNRKSTIISGRTIGEKREHLETANERAAARKKDKRKNALRITFVTLGFVALMILLICISSSFISQKRELVVEEEKPVITSAEPTIEIVDEDASTTGGKITSRMREFIGLAELDFKNLGYQPIKAVIPANSIREVDFYLDGYTGFIKTLIDRDAAVSVEDADRMIRYLKDQEVFDFEYIDVRIEGKAFWK